MNPSLDLIPTDDLIEELWKRCDSGLVCFIQRNSSSSDGDDHTIYWHNGITASLGLAIYAQHRLIQELSLS